MELIVTEKDNVARRIVDILSDGTAGTESVAGVDVYSWAGYRCIGLSGHVVEIDFPSEYENWRDVEPRELVHADIVKRVTREDIVSALRSAAQDADRVTIATDYDREGELIGKEARDLIMDATASVPIDRVRFSSITPESVKEAFGNRNDLDEQLAAAGEARQEIDLVWGAALTRFLTLAANQRGEDFVSVGRVQSPTLKLVVETEREIQAFEPEEYWEIAADLQSSEGGFEADYIYEAADGTQAERIWDAEEASRITESLQNADQARITTVDRRTRTDAPPTPFDTTSFISAAGSLGYSANRTMDVAEQLYTDGHISYPRTDNTVYPDDIELEDILEALGSGPLREATESIATGPLEPTAGDTESTDHPPIHPTTDLPDKADLDDDAWEIYELIARRFLATLSEPARWEDIRVEATAAEKRLKANGRRLTEAGYLDVYPYASSDESILPPVSEGETLEITGVTREDKQTQPPRRYGEARLISKMEELGIGTKSTRHTTVEKLYDRGYLEGDPPRPTSLAMAVIEAVEDHASLVVSEEMTRQLEEDMTAIAEGSATLEEVTEESRDVLDRVFEDLTTARSDIGEILRDAMKADRTVGPCPDCGSDLLLRESGDGSHFVGCDGYPDCRYTLPLPSTGEPTVIDEHCDTHNMGHVKMLAGRKTFVHGCPLCRAETAEETPDRTIGTCPDCGDNHGGELAIKRLRSGARLAGCTRYPDCEYSLPLPRDGEIEIDEADRCSEHDLPALTVHNGDSPWELGCPVCNYREYRRDRNPESLDGIGPKTASKLTDAGIETVGDLADADPDQLAETLANVTADRVREWQAQAT